MTTDQRPIDKPQLPWEEEKKEEQPINDNIEKKHISASRITSYGLCGEAYRRRYIEEEFRLPFTNLVKGLAFHDVTKHNNSQKVTSKIDLAADILTDLAAQRVTDRFELGVELSGDEKTKGRDIVKGKLIDLLTASAKLYSETAISTQPVEVEQKQRLSLPNWERDIVYIMDVEVINGFKDYKFTGKKKSQNDVDTDTGLTAYALAFFAKHGKLPEHISFENYVAYITPKKEELKTAYNPLQTKRDSRDFENFINRATEMLRAIQAGIFMPCPVGHWKCNPRYCEYWQDCRYINSERRAAADSEE
jgi:hypothetical protein